MYFHINISLPQARIKSKYQMENFFHGVIINLEKAMAPHSSTLAWKILWTEEPGRLHTMGSLRIRHNWATSLYFSLSCIGEGNGNPLQCSCLENPRDGGARWAAVYGVAQSRTWLKRLSSSSSSSNAIEALVTVTFMVSLPLSLQPRALECQLQRSGISFFFIIVDLQYFKVIVKWFNYTSMHAKSLQSRPTLCDPMDCSLPDSSVHGDSAGKNPGVGCHALLQGIFPMQGLNLGVSCLTCIGRWVLHH